MKTVCYFHADCFDGMGAAWVVSKFCPEAEMIPAQYKVDAPDWDKIRGAHVIVVDFSFDAETMERLLHESGKLTFLDHHEDSLDAFNRVELAAARLYPHGRFYGQHDQSRSGALIAWDWFHPADFAPRFIQYISDRDLWNFELPSTREFMEGMATIGLNLTDWKNADLENEAVVEALIRKGTPAVERMYSEIKRVITTTQREIDLGDGPVPLINVSRALGSEALATLAKDHAYAVGYFDNATHRVFSIRADKRKGRAINGVARRHGGGGHRFAAGFMVPREHELARH